MVVWFWFFFHFVSWIVWRIRLFAPDKELQLQQVLMNSKEDTSFSLNVELLQNVYIPQ